jgi:hypothetical protein
MCVANLPSRGQRSLGYCRVDAPRLSCIGLFNTFIPHSHAQNTHEGRTSVPSSSNHPRESLGRWPTRWSLTPSRYLTSPLWLIINNRSWIGNWRSTPPKPREPPSQCPSRERSPSRSRQSPLRERNEQPHSKARHLPWTDSHASSASAGDSRNFLYRYVLLLRQRRSPSSSTCQASALGAPTTTR